MIYAQKKSNVVYSQQEYTVELKQRPAGVFPNRFECLIAGDYIKKQESNIVRYGCKKIKEDAN